MVREAVDLHRLEEDLKAGRVKLELSMDTISIFLKLRDPEAIAAVWKRFEVEASAGRPELYSWFTLVVMDEDPETAFSDTFRGYYLICVRRLLNISPDAPLFPALLWGILGDNEGRARFSWVVLRELLLRHPKDLHGSLTLQDLLQIAHQCKDADVAQEARIFAAAAAESLLRNTPNLEEV